MVNPDLMILLKRWTEVKTWGGYVQDVLWHVHKAIEVFALVPFGLALQGAPQFQSIL